MAVFNNDIVLSYIQSKKDQGATVKQIENDWPTGRDLPKNVSSMVGYLHQKKLITRIKENATFRYYDAALNIGNYYESLKTGKTKPKATLRQRTVYELVKHDKVHEIDKQTYDLLKDVI